MIQIHQVIYGDVNGAYSLISSSFRDKEVPTRLANSTDLVDRPPDNVLDAPILRGFPKDDYYLFLKTFPYESKGVRRGRVFTHALILALDDFVKIKDLSNLAEYHLDSIDKSHSTFEIEHKNQIGQSSTPNETSPQVIAAINGLVEHVKFMNTVVMVGRENYFEWLKGLWPGLPIKMKRILKIGAAFNPKKVNSERLNILYIPEFLRQNWVNTAFKIVDINQTEELQSESAYYLSGNLEMSKNLNGILRDFDPKIKEIDDLLQFEKMVPTQIALRKKKKLKIKDLVIFADLISKYNPNPKSKPKEKKSLMDTLLALLQKAEPKEIKMVSNADWTGFQSAESSLSKELETWSYNSVFGTGNGEIASVLLLAYGGQKPSWWGKAIKNGLVEKLSKWNPKYAKTIWGWLKSEVKTHWAHNAFNEKFG